jgi:hypothetical protein
MRNIINIKNNSNLKLSTPSPKLAPPLKKLKLTNNKEEKGRGLWGCGAKP